MKKLICLIAASALIAGGVTGKTTVTKLEKSYYKNETVKMVCVQDDLFIPATEIILPAVIFENSFSFVPAEKAVLSKVVLPVSNSPPKEFNRTKSRSSFFTKGKTGKLGSG